MNSKTLLLLILVLVGGLGAYFIVVGGAGDAERPTTVEPIDPETDPETDEPDEVTDAAAADTVSKPEIQRAPVRTPVTEEQKDPSSYAQGVFGRVVTTSGTPIEDVAVFLVEGQSKNIFAQMMLAQRGVVVPPVARTKTNRLGKFELGIEKVMPDKKYEIRLVSARYADATVPNLTMIAADWVNIGDTKMVQGASVRGRVTVAGTTGLPIPEADVYVTPPQMFATLTPTPGREKGILTQTDANGNFRLTNVTPGMVTISAVKPGFAKVQRANIQVAKDTETEMNFELPQGKEISGVVTDAEGVPIAGAKLTAIAISSKTPMTEETRTDSDGKFEVIGLTDGPFQLSAVAQGFVKTDVKPVMAGEEGEHIVLERQGAASVRVVTKGGRQISRYDLTLKSFFPEQDNYGNVPSASVHRVFSSELDDAGVYTMTGIDPGQYVFEVRAKGFAKTFSPSFTVALRQDPELVQVTMNEGGTIEGVVFGHDGQPLQGVNVITLPNFLDENPFTDMFGTMIPYKITKTGAMTDKQGRFRIKLLAPGPYQLKYQHPDHYTVYQKDYDVREGDVTTIPRLTLDRGTIVSGTVRVDGAPAAQVKVSISTAPDPTKPNGGVSFNADGISNNEGQFVIRKRLPPGRYQARAARQTLPSPLLQVVDFAKTQQEFQVHKGQESHTIHFTLTSN